MKKVEWFIFQTLVFISILYSITGWQTDWNNCGCNNWSILPDLSHLDSHISDVHSHPWMPPLPPIHGHTHSKCASTHQWSTPVWRDLIQHNTFLTASCEWGTQWNWFPKSIGNVRSCSIWTQHFIIASGCQQCRITRVAMCSVCVDILYIKPYLH